MRFVVAVRRLVFGSRKNRLRAPGRDAPGAPARTELSRYVSLSSELGRKKTARERVRGLALSNYFRVASEPTGNFMRCIYCHGVFDDDTSNFERLIDSLMSYAIFVNADHCLEIARGERPLDGRYYHLSFDDGFKNNFTNAAPILAERKIPATFFVPTDYIGADYETVSRYCSERLHLPVVVETLNWDECRQLTEAGFEIASHGRRHLELGTLDEATLFEELRESREKIKEELGVACDKIAWPYGQLKHAAGVGEEQYQGAGYTGCFGAFRGRVGRNRTDPFSVPRHHFEADWPKSHTLCFAFGALGEDG